MIQPHDLELIASLLLKEAGIVIALDQSAWCEARLAPLARRLGHGELAALFRELRLRPTRALVRSVVEACTTHETSFFRDDALFAALRETVLPELLARRASGPIRIWSAACSSGQEVYSLAMLVREHFAIHAGRFALHATDLSHEIVATAAAGRYSAFEVNRGLPAAMLVRHFVQRGGGYEVKPEVRAMVTFAPQNLLEPWHVPTPVDVLLLRNVLYYFDERTRGEVLRRAAATVARDGYLVLGGTETLPLGGPFARQPVGRVSVFRPAPGAPAPAVAPAAATPVRGAPAAATPVRGAVPPSPTRPGGDRR